MKSDFSKISRVSNIIITLCQIQGRHFLEEALLNMWEDAVIKHKTFDAARYGFIEDVRKTFCKEPLIDFLTSTLFFNSFNE